MARHVVAKADEIEPGARKLVVVGGREIGVFNVGGQLYALANKCPHEGAALCAGVVTGLVLSDGPNDYKLTREGEFLRCPWHGWEFDIKTGQSWCDPNSVRVRQFNVTVEHGEDLVKGPYMAETFPVAVEADYVVLDI
jgi:nitrite reductase/ring-hydroxylating ferredoxin subunit